MSTPLTAERLNEIRERADKATPGPWIAPGPERPEVVAGDVRIADCEWLAQTDGEWAQMDLDAKFIAAARQDVPDLLAEIDRLKALVQTLGGEAS